MEAPHDPDQSRGWSDAGISRVIRAIARADADIKGAASDASYTLERLVLTVTGLRDQLSDCHPPRAPHAKGAAPRGRRLAARGLRERRWSSRWPTCGWRPGSCG